MTCLFALLMTATAAAALPPADTARELALTGQVTAVLYKSNFIVRDAAGHSYIRNVDDPDLPHPAVGDLVAIRGRNHTDDNRQTFFYCHHVEILGERPVPPPVRASVKSILALGYDFQNVTTEGEIVDVFQDEIDPRFQHLVLKAGPDALYVIAPRVGGSSLTGDRLVGARVRLTGTCLPHHGGRRTLIGVQLELPDERSIEILSPPPPVGDVPLLEDLHHVSPARITELGRRRIEGVVTAAWQKRSVLVATDDGRLVVAELADAVRLPPVGARVTAVGFPSTDLFHIQLSNAGIRLKEGAAPVPPAEAVPLSARELFTDGHGAAKLKVVHHGRCVSMEGLALTGPADGTLQFDADRSGYGVTVDASTCPEALAGVAPGCLLRVTGVCIAETESWSTFHRYPHVHGFRLVVRRADDVAVLARPPWWTPMRVLAVFALLVAAIVAFFLRNRRLMAVKVRERTALAVELHDTLSQNLAAVSMQIATVRGCDDDVPETTARLLRTAERMVDACRVELRHCLFDLRNRAFDEKDFGRAMRKTLAQAGFDARLSVRFEARRAGLPDAFAHDVLCIVRELALNAVRHGHAASVAVVGEVVRGHLHLTVEDDGAGFAPETCAGPRDGHFGLTGIRERVKRLGGRFVIASRPGCGTHAEAVIPIPRHSPWTRKTR